MKTLQAAKGKIVVQEIKKEENSNIGGILLPTQETSKVINGIITSSNEQGYKVGETVIFQSFSGIKVSIQGVNFIVLNVQDILGIIKNN